ncbi:MAG TPA: hypothetical protein PKD85_01130 [Saprospiraceae bacterium]|nr:hypothetical protein [Saprospiraceae bacterium]
MNLDLSQDKEVLAEVFEKKLFKEDVEGLVTNTSSTEDSLLILRGYIDSWIKDQLLIREAEVNMPKDIDIERLVKDYRSSLIQYSYIEQLYNKDLDTNITSREIEDYYELYKQQYVLGETIIKYTFIKLDKNNQKKLNEFNKLWNNNKNEEIETFAKNQAVFYQKSSDWELLNGLLVLLPKNSIIESNLKSKQKVEKEDKDFKFFVKVEDIHRKGENPPLEYITSTITKVILNDRKTALIKNKKELLFNQNLENSNIKKYLD